MNRKYSFTYGKIGNHTYSGKNYSIQFPEEFRMVEDSKYPFYACLYDPEQSDKPVISIKPGRIAPLQTFGMEIHSKSLLYAIIRLNALKGVGGLLWVAERSRRFVIETASDEYLCFYDVKNGTATYYVYLVFQNSTQPVVITLCNIEEQEADQEGRTLVTELVQHLYLKVSPYTALGSLMDSRYLGAIMVPQIATSWKKLRDASLAELEHLFFIEIQITQQMMRSAQKRGEYRKASSEAWYAADLKNYARNVEQLLDQTMEYLKEVFPYNLDNPVFYDLITDMEQFIQASQKVSVSIDHEEKSEPVTNAAKAWAQWRYCSLLRSKAQQEKSLADLEEMDKNFRAEYAVLLDQQKVLLGQLEVLEHKMDKERNRLQDEAGAALQKIQSSLERKEAELGECYAQEKTLRQQLQQLSFFQRSQKEQLNQLLSAVIIRTEGIRTDIDNLEDSKNDVILQAATGLDPMHDMLGSYRMRLRLKNEELAKVKRMLDRNSNQLEGKRQELQLLYQEMEQVQGLAEAPENKSVK